MIAEPDTVDAQGDVMSAETIEEIAHNFLLRPRKFDNRHDWRELDAAPRYSPSRVMQIVKSIKAREFFKKFPDVRKQLWGSEFWSIWRF